MKAASSAQRSLKGRLMSGSKNFCSRPRFSLTRLLWRAPYSSSALTMEHSRTCEGVVARRTAATLGELPFRMRIQVLVSSKTIELELFSALE